MICTKDRVHAENQSPFCTDKTIKFTADDVVITVRYQLTFLEGSIFQLNRNDNLAALFDCSTNEEEKKNSARPYCIARK